MKKTYYLFIAIILFGFLYTKTSARAQDFDPNNIISNLEIMDYNSMGLADIQKFLVNKGSYLANYSCPDSFGTVRKASEIIYNAAAKNYDCDGAIMSDNPTEEEKILKCKKITISPKFLLVLLQKEQSLIEGSSPSERNLDWAAGYGCPDSGNCNVRWRGFGKQVNSAALQFRDYMDNPQYYTYKAGGTYNISNTNRDPIVVTPVNQATAGLYNYTPHVYNGNFNFYKIWQRWFTKIYPDGSLLQADGEVGVWLLQNGVKRPFLSMAALVSRFDVKKIIKINKSDLNKYETGVPIKFAQYSLIKSPRGTIFLLVDDKKRGFTSMEAFRKMGFNPTEVVNARWEDINYYADGACITATSTYPTGALLQNNKTGGIYYVVDGIKAPLIDKIFLTVKFKNKKIIKVTSAELDQYTTAKPYLFGDGELLKTKDSPYVYVISGNKKILITSDKIFNDLGYKIENIIIVPSSVLYLYDAGTPITQVLTGNGQ
ncbi:hypothetical protein KKA93_00640 [Patescibacteria group bacterium]|nr:hypothetical protein [Patescibacteria group bacterium]MBU1663154.1 hypothetical protein [Patescibacteria group bacterium]MBU1934086.1 hypothetical protein [Patescibacteria group bacterium]MBU2008103.1 hypothetical protein [Patescibacteria group bacterium]MBU2233402.1 hypothetical protein [Patescibacteria group bacterium]